MLNLDVEVNDMRKITMLMMTVSAALAIALGAAQKDSRADAQLQAAINKETVEGDLKSAIEMYKKVAQSGNRAAAAKALVRMGQCYEKLGDAEARKAYERVVASYADQRDVAAEARTRLAAMGGRTTGAAEAVARRVWTGKEADTTGTPSLDSRYLSYVHRPTGDLALRDLSTGENRLVTNKGPRDKSWQFADMNVISPDGKLLAYSWCVEGKPLCDYELRVSAPDGSGMKVLFHSTQMEFWGRPCAITPDNKYVLTALEKGGPPNTTRIAFIAVSDGSIRDLKTIKTGTQKDRLVLSPDGRFVAYSQPSGRVGNNLGKPLGYKNIYVLPTQGGAEIPLVADPSDDKVLGWMPDGKSILFSSNRSGTYDAWLLPVENGKAAGPPRLAKRNIGVDAWPLGFTRDSAFYYGRRTGSSDMYMVTLDQATSKPAGEPTLRHPDLHGNYFEPSL